MSRTIRAKSDKIFRKPKRNRADKTLDRFKAVPPDAWDDLVIAGRDEDWFLKKDKDHPSASFKKKMKKMKKEAREFRKKDFDFEEV